MSLLTALQQRQSTPALVLKEPAPSDEHLTELFCAAVAAPDHGAMRPWQFLVVRGAARQRLGDVFATALQQRNPNADIKLLEQERAKPLRAPLIIVVVARLRSDNPKVPEQEQILSAGCAAQHIQLAANALGYGSIWLTGDNANDWTVSEALGLEFDDRIVGFIYLGTPKAKLPTKKRPDPQPFIVEWTEPQQGQTL